MQTLTDSNIEVFAASVRLELRDLPKSVIEELTGDLEASLQERKVDEGTDFQLGSPVEYAAELREAAGVEPKSARQKFLSAQAFSLRLENWMRKYSITRSILEFAISTRPLWWVIRATIAWGLLTDFYASSLADFALLSLFVFLSIQWGRKKWFTGKFFEAILLPLNAIAVLLLLPASVLLSNAVNSAMNAQQVMQEWSVDEGLTYNGEPVTDLKAFDSKNTEVNGLTFEDQNGTKIEIGVPLSELTQYQVPDVIGLSFYDAHNALLEAKVLGVDYVYLDNVREEDAYVVSVEPAAGSAVTARDVITVTFARK